MNTCGECKHIRADRFSQFVCTKTGRPAGLLQSKECFEPTTLTTETKMEENKDIKETKTKVCKRCGRELPLHEFGRHARTADGLKVYCRQCSKEAMMRTRKAKVEKDKERATYGLASYETDDLINELRRRGLSGYLKQVIEISV